MKKKHKIAFSMVELSVVLVIISVIVGSMITVNKMSSMSKMAVARSLTASSPVKDMDGLYAWLETTMPQSIDNADINSGLPVQRWYDLSPKHNDALFGDDRNTCAGAPVTVNTSSTCYVYRTDGINGLPTIFNSGDNGYGCLFRFSDYKQLELSDFTIIIVEKYIRNTTNIVLPMPIISQSINSTLFDTGGLYIGYGARNDGNNIYFAHRSTIIHGFPDFAELHYPTPSVQNIPKIHVFGLKQSVGRYYFLNGSNSADIVPSAASTYFVSDEGKQPLAKGLSCTGNYATGYKPAIYIGSYNDNNYNGHLGEIIIFSRSLSDNERKEIEQYLSKKWNIPLLN
jgi:hypothetical protein